MNIHLTGMGVLGCLTAWQLERCGVTFSWSDTRENINAWKASTGACYPSGGDLDTQCYNTWLTWVDQDIYPSDIVEVCSYWVDGLTKSLPHGLNSTVKHCAGNMRLAGRSIHLDAQELVHRTREHFMDLEVTLPPKRCRRVTSHGHGVTLRRYLWGWTRLVKLQCDPSIVKHGRPSFYLRKNRFQFAYAYPKPHSEWWYAGTSLINQTIPKSLRVLPKYKAWKERFLELSNGLVKVVGEGDILQGWRPCVESGLSKTEGYKRDRSMLTIDDDGTIHYPTLATGGFRHFPVVWLELSNLLGLDH